MRTLVLAVTVLWAGCAPHYLRAPTAARVSPDLPAHSVTRHVIVVSIDGLRPDAIETYGAPTLQKLAREGSFTLRASTILPSKTLPSHTSMLTGVPPEQHGVVWNTVVTRRADRVPLSTVFGVARSRGYVTAAFFSKPKFQPLQIEGSLDYSQAPGGWYGGWRSGRTVTDVEHYLSTAKPNLLFVHLPDPDFAGHSKGWMSEAYGRAVQEVDDSLTRLGGVSGHRRVRLGRAQLSP
jgi:predicted AlkP superfamily pyrophosphatase or phosphodiesterase